MMCIGVCVYVCVCVCVCVFVCVCASTFNHRSFNEGLYKDKKNRGIHNAEFLLISIQFFETYLYQQYI